MSSLHPKQLSCQKYDKGNQKKMTKAVYFAHIKHEIMYLACFLW